MPAAALDAWAPIDDEIPPAWDDPGFDAWIDELAAADPQREPTAGEVARAAESERLSSELAAVDVVALSDDERVAVATAAARWEAHYAAVRARAVAAFAGPAPEDTTCAAAFAWTDIAAALRLGDLSARQLVARARHLHGRLHATAAALLAGEITWGKAVAVIDASAPFTHEQCAALEQRVLPRAAERTPAQHAAAVARAVRAVDPDGWQARRRQARRDVALIRISHGDGIAELVARNLDSVDADLVYTAADTWARQTKAGGDRRSLEALRVAYLVETATRYLSGDRQPTTAEPSPPRRHGIPAVVTVTIPLPTLIAGRGDGMLTGSGEPLPADAIAELLHQGARIRFALTDPATGQLVGISTRHHDPTTVMRVWVALRDLTCRTPNGTLIPVAGQDLDHITSYASAGGATTITNLHAPTRSWHRAKTLRHWTVHANADGSITWTSVRTNRSYTTHPYDHGAGP